MRTLIGVAAMAIVVGCATPAILTPATGPNTEYPCGVNGVQCPQHMCCWEGSTCGGAFPSVGCPAGMCCQVDSGGMVGANLRQRTYSQWRDSSTP